MARAQARAVRNRAWLARLLALNAGFVDAVGFLVLVRLFVAHMSGNTAALGVALGERHWGEALFRASPIPAFVLGTALGAAACEIAARRGVRSTFALACGLETILLLLFLVCGYRPFHTGSLTPDLGWPFYLLAALPALAMGVQNASLRRVGGVGVRTTFVSGVLTNLAEEAVQVLFWLSDTGRRRRLGLVLRLAPRQDCFQRMTLHLSLWAAYVLGAAAGAWALGAWGLLALAAPVGGLAVLVVWGLIRPVTAPGGGPPSREWAP
jgi:uncharacterized membrane protein YoaK (UPF0700 family)